MRAKDQMELQAQLEQFRNLVGLAVDAIVTGDPEGNFTSANLSATELTGYSFSELDGMNMTELFSAEEQQRAPLRYDLLKQGKVVVTERDLTRKDGTTVPIEMKSRMLPDGSYHAFIRDLSERRAAAEALRLSEEKFSRAFRLCPDAINITRLKDATFLDVNENFTRLIGWSREEVIGHSALPGDLDIWVDEVERDQLARALQLEGEAIEHRVRLRRKDGFVGVGLMSARVIEIDKEICVLAITRDITEQEALIAEKKRLEQQMLQAQKLESLGILAGGIAHDFNNILMAVLGHCELAQRRCSPESPAQQNLQQIKSAINKAADLANQMLAYSGKGQFVIEPCELSKMIDEMRQMLVVSVSKKAQLSFDLAADLPCVEGDLTQLRQIVLNLVINASDALDGQAGYVKVATALRECAKGELFLAGFDEALPGGRYLEIEVADDGCGMDAETRQRIFDPFFTTKFAGRGLGMAAVLGIVRGHRGALEIDSEPGRGTRINVLLPASTAVEKSAEPEADYCEWHQSGLVLLVDDDPAILEIGGQMLAELGFVVEKAEDGVQALERLKALDVPPRLVLLDLTMPRMGGEEAFLLIRKDHPRLPVIISSGFNEQEVSAGFKDHGSVAFLKKPYQLIHLQQSISALLDTS